MAKILVLALALLLVAPALITSTASAYAPQTGDYFNYHEVETLNNGTGSNYTGYTEQTIVNGGEQINSVTGGTTAVSYSYTWTWSNSQSSTTEAVQSGSYTFSPTTYLYVNGNDDQQGYVNPTVWFYINSSAPVGSTVFLLNTGATVMSRNYSYYLPSIDKNVTTIFVQGIASYYGSPLNNSYGMNNAKYTWNAYFDPTTGYIVGYNYVEQDVGSGYSFTWTDNLYVISASYLSATSASSSTNTSQSMISTSTPTIPIPTGQGNSLSGGISSTDIYVLLGVMVLIILIAIIASMGSEIPQHAQTSYSGPPTPPVSLVPEMPQQIVIRDVAKVYCQFCGTAVPTTVDTCPRCGGRPTGSGAPGKSAP